MMLDESDKLRFRSWLERNTSLGPKSIGDTVSRLTRVDKMTPLNTTQPAEDFLFRLGKKPAFTQLSPPIKSQLKRAYTLFYQFRNG